jgi:transcription elongation factor Elf1
MSIPVAISETCPECNVDDDYLLAATIDEMIKHEVTCKTCGHKFVVVVSLELDSWTQ